MFPTVTFDPSPFRHWLAEGGRFRLGFDPFDPEFVPDVAARPVSAPTPAGVGHALRWRWHSLKRLIPGYVRRVEARDLQAYVGSDPRRGLGAAPPRAVTVDRMSPTWGQSPRGLNLIGPLRSESGLGQAARASLEALRLIGRPFTHVDITDKYPSRNALDVGLRWDTYGQLGGVNLLHLNADETLTLGLTALKHRLGGRFNAAMWFWESGVLPDRSRGAFRVVDELWVASNYLRDVFGQYARVPVHVIGLAAELPESASADRSRYGWGDDELVFLFVYDALSSYGRKNPDKALEAFTRAFAPDYRGVRFVLKVSNLNKFPEMQKDIYRFVEGNPAVSIIDEYMERSEVLDLMAAADVYVSLHAAEGLGLTLLEAMALGTPVICTGYSGNLDFTTPENSWLVGYDMIETDRRYGPYPPGAVWASPRVDEAVDLMRHVAQHRDEIEVKAAAARQDARRTASVADYARRLDAQLRRVL
jgi:glycosyltransferase involved in cell wall biosynthesis